MYGLREEEEFLLEELEGPLFRLEQRSEAGLDVLHDRGFVLGVVLLAEEEEELQELLGDLLHVLSGVYDELDAWEDC